MFIYRNGGVDSDRIIDDADRHKGNIGRVSPQAEQMFCDAGRDGLSENSLKEGRSAVGMSIEAMREIDANLTPAEKGRRRQLASLMDPDVSVFATAAPERITRPEDPRQQWLAMMEIVNGIGVPGDLSLYEKAGLLVSSSPLLDMIPHGVELAMKMAREHVLKQVGGFVNVYDDASPKNVIGDLRADSKRTGIGHEANLVTESARTEAEAKRNLEWYKGALRSGAERIAIKPTSLVPFSDSSLAKPVMKKKLAEALKEIFEVADKTRVDEKGVPLDKPIVTVDSERSDIVDMVRDSFLEAAMEFPGVKAQIAIQAYLHDSETMLLDPLMEASKKRVHELRGEPLGVRLVNGANEAGEKWLSSVMGWHGTPLVSARPNAHANYMRLRKRMIDPIKEGDFTLTVATMNMVTLMNNLQELARAGVFANKNQGFVHFSMLKGMTGQEVFRYLKQRYNVKAHEYVPVISMEGIVELFKYYLRRIEELASKVKDLTDSDAIANYLSLTARYGVGSPEWNQTQVENGVIMALSEHEKYSGALDPKIHGYRGEEDYITMPLALDEYEQVPSAAPGSIEDSAWIDERISKCAERTDADAEKIDLDFQAKSGKVRERKSLRGPTRPNLKLADYELADKEDIDTAFRIAEKDERGWAKKSVQDRLKILSKGVVKMRDSRDSMDEALMLNTGKPVLEADEEVNEAMDFLNLARLHMGQLAGRENLEFVQEGNGVATVICPKNFPQAIPLAHIVARLLAGYRVIVKPSGGEGEESVLATYKMVQALWEAGVPKQSLIFLPCNNENAAYLAKKSERIGYTGSTGVAQNILKSNPEVEMIAETGGRNFMIVDGTSNLKDVATEVLKSMCGFAGQKCSKPIAVILTKDVNLQKFKEHILGQLQEMLNGSALVRHADVPPLTREYSEDHGFSQKVMNCLPGEEWLEGDIPTGILDGNGEEFMKHVSAQPKKMGEPGIRFINDAANFDFTKIEEIFAPIISIAQIDGGVEEAVEIVNSTSGSLTGSLFSESRENIFHALNNWRTGNLYIRRGCTGAKGHQGFGDGTGDSHLGAHGAKTGTIEWQIMNSSVRRKEGAFAKYDKKKIPGFEEGLDTTGLIKVLQDMEASVGSVPESIIHAGWSYLYEGATYFSQKRQAPYQTKGQYDWIESHNVGKIGLVVNEKDSAEEVICKIFAAVAAGNPLNIYINDIGGDLMNEIKRILGDSPANLFEGVQIWSNFDYLEQDLAMNLTLKKSNSERIACLMYASAENVSPSVNEIVTRLAADYSTYIDRRPPTGDGLVDMVTQFRQQSYCWVNHVAGDTAYDDALAVKRPDWVPYVKAA